MDSATIRERFVRFFESKNHKPLPSASLVPRDDPSLLFTTAGMLPLVPYFTGRKQPPARRIVTIQKCFRTTDLADVGDSYHNTFFEMLGNFGIGDYWKRDAIVWGWEFATKHLGLAPETLVGTVYETDDEAYKVWRDELHLPESRIFRFGTDPNTGESPNFWKPGPVGPCGPCSELQVDRGPRPGWPEHDCYPGHECERYLELWNYVFQEFDQRDGELIPLPMKNIDTGMGFERLCQVMQGVTDTYRTDLFTGIIGRIEDLAGKRYGDDADSTRSMRIIADHARGATFLIADGILPGNEWRGYVLRRLIRRAALHGRLLGLRTGFLATVCAEVIKDMQRHYHELTGARDRILETVKGEEEKFANTLASGLSQLEEAMAEAKKHGAARIDGKTAFRLHDTYGFPLELTRELAAKEGVAIDESGFERSLDAQREQSRQRQKFGPHEAARAGQFYTELRDKEGLRTNFVGYERLREESRVVAIFLGTAVAAEATKGMECEIVLDRTPFYPEGGGQVGDAGELVGDNGRAIVTDTQEPSEGVIVHAVSVIEGTLRVGDVVNAQVDVPKRRDTMRNHTATHMLHATVRRALGESVHQAGSLVEPARLRFDFTYDRALTPEQLRRIEVEINEAILDDRPVRAHEMPLQQALASGALHLFDEKYSADKVRVMEVKDFSKELCGGTHVSATGEIGLFVVTREESVGTGVRRIEGLTGHGAIRYVNEQRETLGALADQLRVPRSRVPEAVVALHEAQRRLERELTGMQRETADSLVDGILERGARVDGALVVAAEVTARDANHLRAIGDRLRDRVKSGVIVLGAKTGGSAKLVGVVTKDLVPRVSAKDLVTLAANVVGGKGGGRPDSAQGGGPDAARLGEALEAAQREAKDRLSRAT
ncbi:MAG: alanine--tRNA ligase [Chloroflexi bacterium 13_1_40CM_4_68_4]|nr:MAG: alanine--tRNA ligase [Chloroflexi bacterium 13_1_40CM_4_68_4]